MLRTHLAFVALVPALALGGVACTDVDSGEVVLESEAAIMAPRPDMFGTYRGDARGLGQMPLLVLRSDGTYHRTIVLPCMPGDCPAVADDGLYQLWGRGGGNYVSFYPDDGGPVDRFQYAVAADTLRLRRMTEREAFHLHKTISTPWCAEAVDCQLQNLPAGPCGGGTWSCFTSTEICKYSCRPPL